MYIIESTWVRSKFQAQKSCVERQFVGSKKIDPKKLWDQNIAQIKVLV